MARPSPGAERVVTVLEFLAARPDERFTLSELARGCDLNKATAHALLTELTARGVLLRHPDEKRYSLGPRLVPVGTAASRGYRAEDFTAGTLRRLATSTGAVAAAVVRQLAGDYATVVNRADSGRDAPVPLRWPLVPPNGAVFFAWADEPSVEAWLARCPAIGSVQLALAGLEAARRDGYVVGAAVPEWQRLMAVMAERPSVADAVAPADAHQEAVRDALADLARSEALITEIDPATTYPTAYVAAPVFDDHGVPILGIVVGHPRGANRRGDELLAMAAKVVAAADELTEAVHGAKP
jgi:DNA-binding IclR family transcriptional regulator